MEKHEEKRTVWRRLKCIEIKTVVVRKVIDVGPVNKSKHLAFAKEYIKNPIEFWHNVFWTYGCLFQFQDAFGR